MTLANKITAAFKNFKTFTFNDVKVLFSGKKGRSDITLQVTLSRMVAKGSIYRVSNGVFSMKRRDEFAGFAFSPFYYGGLAALMVRDLIDDQVRMEVMTTRPVRKSFSKVYGNITIVLHHIPKKYYFGFEDVKYGDITVPASDPEKTLIDLFYYNEKMSLQDYAELLKAVRIGKLIEYLKVYDGHTRTTVLNFVKKYKKLADSGKMDNPY